MIVLASTQEEVNQLKSLLYASLYHQSNIGKVQTSRLIWMRVIRYLGLCAVLVKEEILQRGNSDHTLHAGN